MEVYVQPENTEKKLDPMLANAVVHFFDHIPFNKMLGMEIGYAGRNEPLNLASLMIAWAGRSSSSRLPSGPR